MRELKWLMLFCLTLSLLVFLANGKAKTTKKLALGSLSPLDLESARFDGDILFDLSWPGSEAKEQDLKAGMDAGSNDEEVAMDTPKVLPDQLLSESYSASETVTMTTVDNEQYTCLLPDLSGERTHRDTDESVGEISARILLKSLRGYCTKLLMGYWTYELCHSRYVRQYHEEQVEKGNFKIDEYFLGKVGVKVKKGPLRHEEMDEDDEEDDGDKDDPLEKPPRFYFNGKSYPYHEVSMGLGTVCDINNVPRSITIKYICDMESHQSGTLLHVAELTTCKYEAIVSTRQFCNNKYFRLKENPRHTINCYPEGDAPRRPTVLLEHELSMGQFYTKGSKETKQQAPSLVLGKEQYSNDFDYDPQETFEDQVSRGLPPDEQFLTSFINGENCLRGGAGWWLHEICYGKYVRQVHEDNNGRIEVYLGYWNEAEHKAWFERSGKRKQSKVQVTHLYTNGDICDVTGTPRTCHVKFKCVKTSKVSQVTIFLEEPTTCSYTLTIEASFLCPLLEKTNEIGLILLPDPLSTQSEPPTTEPPVSHSHSKIKNDSPDQESQSGTESPTTAPSVANEHQSSPSKNTDSHSHSDNEPHSSYHESQSETNSKSISADSAHDRSANVAPPTSAPPTSTSEQSQEAHSSHKDSPHDRNQRQNNNPSTTTTTTSSIRGPDTQDTPRDSMSTEQQENDNNDGLPSFTSQESRQMNSIRKEDTQLNKGGHTMDEQEGDVKYDQMSDKNEDHPGSISAESAHARSDNLAPPTTSQSADNEDNSIGTIPGDRSTSDYGDEDRSGYSKDDRSVGKQETNSEDDTSTSGTSTSKGKDTPTHA